MLKSLSSKAEKCAATQQDCHLRYCSIKLVFQAPCRRLLTELTRTVFTFQCRVVIFCDLFNRRQVNHPVTRYTSLDWQYFIGSFHVHLHVPESMAALWARHRIDETKSKSFTVNSEQDSLSILIDIIWCYCIWYSGRWKLNESKHYSWLTLWTPATMDDERATSGK